MPVVHAHFGIVMRADDEHFGLGGGSFLDGDEIICLSLIHILCPAAGGRSRQPDGPPDSGVPDLSLIHI